MSRQKTMVAISGVSALAALLALGKPARADTWYYTPDSPGGYATYDYEYTPDPWDQHVQAERRDMAIDRHRMVRDRQHLREELQEGDYDETRDAQRQFNRDRNDFRRDRYRYRAGY